MSGRWPGASSHFYATRRRGGLHTRGKSSALEVISTMSIAAERAADKALDLVAKPTIWDVDEDDIVDAMANLMHLAWFGTNDDGEGMLVDDLIERASVHFNAECGTGDGLANHEPGRSDRELLITRRDNLRAALAYVHSRIDVRQQPRSLDPLHNRKPPRADKPLPTRPRS